MFFLQGDSEDATQALPPQLVAAAIREKLQLDDDNDQDILGKLKDSIEIVNYSKLVDIIALRNRANKIFYLCTFEAGKENLFLQHTKIILFRCVYVLDTIKQTIEALAT